MAARPMMTKSWRSRSIVPNSGPWAASAPSPLLRARDPAREGRRDGTGMRDRGREEAHTRGDRRGAEAWIERGKQTRRRQRDRECREHCKLIVMGDERADRARVDRTPERGDQIIHRGLERAADADLRQDDGGEHGP